MKRNKRKSKGSRELTTKFLGTFFENRKLGFQLEEKNIFMKKILIVHCCLLETAAIILNVEMFC